MSDNKQNKPRSPEDILGSTDRVPAPTPSAAPAPPVTNTTQADIQAALAKLQLRKLTKEMQEQDDEESSKNNARLQTAEKVREADARREANQDFCTHVKPNGRTALGGQKTHSHVRGQVYTFICQYCQKEFNETNIPPNLRVSAEMVGGPTT